MRAEDSSVSLTLLLPALATVAAAALTALAGAGWTADGRLLRRAERELDLAAKVPKRQLRAKLREAAYADVDEALARRDEWRPVIGVALASLLGALIGWRLIPWWVSRHPEQGAGVVGVVWALLMVTYVVGSLFGAVRVVAMLWRRGRRGKEKGDAAEGSGE